MEDSKVILSIPLQQLMEEHVTLRAEMDLFYEIIEDIEIESGTDVVQLFAELFKRVAAFTINLKAHSQREEVGDCSL